MEEDDFEAMEALEANDVDRATFRAIELAEDLEYERSQDGASLDTLDLTLTYDEAGKLFLGLVMLMKVNEDDLEELKWIGRVHEKLGYELLRESVR